MRNHDRFRWVDLSIENLSNPRRLSLEKDVRSELGKLPPDLKDQYMMIYRDILYFASFSASAAKRTFSWILAAKRVLSTEELVAAVAIDEAGHYHEDLDAPLLLDICR